MILMKPSDPIGNAFADDGFSVPIEAHKKDSRSIASKVQSPGTEDINQVALSELLEKLHAVNADLLSRRAGHKNVQLDELLKTHTEKKKTTE